MQLVINLLKDTMLYVLGTLFHNFAALALGILIAAAIKVYLDPDKMKDWLMRRSSVSIPATVAFGAFTPLCACGTMAVVISMLATALPWGPIMAFLISSPLMSPEEFVLLSGIISPSFAITLAVASVIIGLGSGYVTHIIEKKTDFLKDQLRFADSKTFLDSNSGESVGAASRTTSCCGVQTDSCSCIPDKKNKTTQMIQAIFDIGIRRILPLFSLFAAIGYLINTFIPSTWISAVFGAQNIFAVPLAALIGIPLYVNGDSSIPLIESLMQGGVSTGAMLAFMITGPGTSAGVIAGIATIMKKRAVALYVAYLLIGGILLGYVYDLLFIL